MWHYPVAGPALEGPSRAEVRAEFGTPDGKVVILQASRIGAVEGASGPPGGFGTAAGRPRVGVLASRRCTEGGRCGIFKAELRSSADRAGIADRVRFLGQRADVSRLMAAADVFCQPNTGPEPFGIVFVEALYAGLAGSHV